MEDMHLKETYVSGEEIYDGAIIKVQKWKVELPDGRHASREVVIHKGAAAVVPIDAKGYVTLVKQHRVAIDSFTWEIPAGKLDFAEEDPLACAKRELEEETGLRAKKWRLLNSIVTTPGFCTERIGIYLATELSKHNMRPDADEFLNHTTMHLDEAVGLVMKGEIRDSKTCIGLLMAKMVLDEEKERISQHIAFSQNQKMEYRQ